MDAIKELLIGCGSRRDKRIPVRYESEWKDLVTLDINGDHKPDIVWDLTRLPLPFADNTFAEVHAYEVLEHLGAQGDYKAFFAQFTEFWRILAPGGYFAATVPAWNSEWAWGDPSHTRVIQRHQLTFLDQTEYTRQIGVTPMSDFRYIYKADFTLDWCTEETGTFGFILQAIKPSRITVPG